MLDFSATLELSDDDARMDLNPVRELVDPHLRIQRPDSPHSFIHSRRFRRAHEALPSEQLPGDRRVDQRVPGPSLKRPVISVNPTGDQLFRSRGSQPNGCLASFSDNPRTSISFGSLVPRPSVAAIARWLSPGYGPVAAAPIGS